MAYETELWPYVPAKHFGARRDKPPRVIVVHDMEFPERLTAAEDVARYFATTKTPASAHINVDADSIVQSVKDSYVAYAAPGCNHDGIQVELAGYAKQSRSQWRDKYSLALLGLAADAVAQYCLKYDIAPMRLTDAQLKAGSRGIVGHDQVSRVYLKSTHTDPGPNFPWARFVLWVKGAYEDRR